MCGIAGFLGTKPLSESTQSSVLSSILHRGPDGSGIFNSQLKSNYLALFHTRLSIVDLDSRSAQPFAKHQFVLVYNGEIYNFIEIRKELEREGCLFSTGSDTEVVIEAFRVWGKDCVSRFEGMWAFALFDQKQQQVWLSRDRFGEKPLYYLYQSGNLYFASEIKALAVMLGQWPEINPDQVRRYLDNGFKSLHKSGQTWFRNVHEFPAASISLVEQPEAINPKKYWRLEYKPQEMTRDNAVEGVREHLLQAVSLRLRADVPIAFCLSGGVDSATLASIATKEFGQKIHTFSIVDRDERYNEIEEINDVVSDLNCDQHVVEIGYDGFWERMQRLVSAHDAPIATVSYYVHSFLSEAISENGYKVAISGTGADEIFTGYYDHYSFWLSLMKDRDDFDLLRKDWEKGYGEFVRNPLLKDPQIILQNPNERGHIYLNRDDFNRMLVDPIDEDFYEKKHLNSDLICCNFTELSDEEFYECLRWANSKLMKNYYDRQRNSDYK